MVSKSKGTPVQAYSGPEGTRRLRLPVFKTIGTNRWYGFQYYAPPAFTTTKYSQHSFLLQPESIPGPQCSRIDDTIGHRTRDLPACSPVPQPTAPPCAHFGYLFVFVLLKITKRTGTRWTCNMENNALKIWIPIFIYIFISEIPTSQKTYCLHYNG